jgi:hypothetical protein
MTRAWGWEDEVEAEEGFMGFTRDPIQVLLGSGLPQIARDPIQT